MSDASLSTIAVIGCGGMIGRATVDLLLENGYTILGLDVVPASPDDTQASLPKFTRVVADVTVYDELFALVKQHECDGVVCLVTPPRNDGNPRSQHDMHNINVTATYNVLRVAADLGIDRVVLASSVNAIGLIYSQKPTIHYLPIDEAHPCAPEDAYSLSKLICELQGASIVRRHPTMRVASLRFHWVIPSRSFGASQLAASTPDSALWKEHVKDLMGWTSLAGSARACLLGLIASTTTFPAGTHEAFHIVSRTIAPDGVSGREFAEKWYPEVKEVRKPLEGRTSLWDSDKAERMLGWVDSED